jgi:hypothetical protein
MRRIAFIAVFAGFGVAAQAQVLWDQSQLVNRVNGGTGAIAGMHLSQLETAAQGGTPSDQNSLGAGVQGPSSNVCADDFTIGSGGATITGFSVFSYITGATTPGVTGVNWAIGAAPVVQSGLTTTTVASTFWDISGTAVYRVGSTTTSDATRRIQITTVTGLNMSLAAGTYFLSFSVNPGNFSPVLPTSTATHGKNMMQSVAGAAFTPFLDGIAPNTYGADMAFVINGSPVPEPASMAVLGLGALALIRRRRQSR